MHFAIVIHDYFYYSDSSLFYYPCCLRCFWVMTHQLKSAGLHDQLFLIYCNSNHFYFTCSDQQSEGSAGSSSRQSLQPDGSCGESGERTGQVHQTGVWAPPHWAQRVWGSGHTTESISKLLFTGLRESLHRGEASFTYTSGFQFNSKLCSDWHGHYTVFIAPYYPEQGKSIDVYFTSEHSFTDLCYDAACGVFTHRWNLLEKCDIIYLCK